MSVNWGSSLFPKTAAMYNHELATTASALAAAAYGEHDDRSDLICSSDDSYIRSAMNKLDLDDVETFNYKNTSNADKVAYAIGHIKADSTGTTRYVVVSIRGTDGLEWYADFNIGNGGLNKYHAGFAIAEIDVYNQLENYLDRNIFTYAPNAKLKILVTGHSRGAAVANLLAARLTKDTANYFKGRLGKENVYGYTFATPNVGNADEVWNSSAYNNINNFVYPEDFVPYMPLAARKEDWGYWKYGKTYAFPSNEVNIVNDVDQYEVKFKENFNNNFSYLTGKNFNSYWWQNYTAVQAFARDIQQIAPSVNDYNNKSYHTVLFLESYTPLKYFQLLCHILARNDLNSMATLPLLTVDPTYGPPSRFFLANGNPFAQNMKYSHAPETYMAWLQSTKQSDLETNLSGNHSRISGSDNVEVYICKDPKARMQAFGYPSIKAENDRELVLRIVDGVIEESIMSDMVGTNISENGIDIFLPDGVEYEIDGLDNNAQVETNRYDIASTETIGLIGDANKDGNIDVLDLMLIRGQILGIEDLTGAALTMADANEDRVVNIVDIMRVRKQILSGQTGS